MAKLTKYTLWCPEHEETLSTDYRTDDQGLPTCCPLNEAHTNITGIAIVSVEDLSIARTRIIDVDDIPPEKARTKVVGLAFDVPAGEWFNHDFSFPYLVNMLSGGGEAGFSKDGDIFEFIIMPDTTLGALTAGGAIPASGTVVLNVSSTVTDNIGIGYWAKFEANPANFPTSPEFLVLDYDEAAGTITVQGNGTEKTVNPADYVAMSIKYAEACEVQPGEFIDIGSQAAGSAGVPAGTPLRLRYYNSGVGAIRVKFRLVLKYQPRK
jgi:hypothetical protein